MPIKMWSAFCWKCFNEVFCLQKSYYSNVVNDIVDVNLVLKHFYESQFATEYSSLNLGNFI